MRNANGRDALRHLRRTWQTREYPEALGIEGQRAEGETDMAEGHVGPEAQDPHRLRAMPCRDPRRATDEDTRGSGGMIQRIGSLESRMTRKCPVRFGGGRREKDASGCP